MNGNVGRVIKTVRAMLGYSQKEIAKHTGYSVNYISLVENGHRGVGFSVLEKIGNAMEVPDVCFQALAKPVPADGSFKHFVEESKRLTWTYLNKLAEKDLDRRRD
jgi:transcriptional regulator with XRE-family HTH domain